MSADLISRKALINILEDVEQDGLLKVCQIIELLEDQQKAYEDTGWIPVEERLPEEPKENPVFDDKPLELYLVDMGGSYPLRAFWNGKEFTDGWSVLKVTAWMPLPEPYRPERSNDEKK